MFGVRYGTPVICLVYDEDENHERLDDLHSSERRVLLLVVSIREFNTMVC